MDKTHFDFITGNVPWDGEIDKDFLIKYKNEILSPTGTMAVITSASWLCGNSNKNKELRSTLLATGNVKKIYTYPAEVFINPSTQKPIKAVGAAIIFTKNEQYADTTLVRYFGDNNLKTTTQLSSTDGILLYLGETGKALWNVCVSNIPKLPYVKYVPSNKPKIHFSSKLDLNYLGSSKPLGCITGKKLLTGVQLDLDGTNGWVPELKESSSRTIDDNAAKRYMLTFETVQQAKNAYYHVSMRVFGLLLSMSSTISHVSDKSLGRMPNDILNGGYANLEEYESAYYKSKNLSAAMVEWIANVGNDVGNISNLEGNDIISSVKRSSERVKVTGEIFTPNNYVDDILYDLVELGMCDGKKRILEATCGDGNFVLPIIKMKISKGMSVIDALRTTHAIDIMEDNVALCKKRLLEYLGDDITYVDIINRNIVVADALNGWDYKEWKPKVSNFENVNNLLGI